MIWDNIRQEQRIRSFASGVEVAPKTGMPHLQCYFETESERGHSIAEMQAWPCFDKRISGGVAIVNEIVKGSAEDNILYCLKMRPQDLSDGSGPNTEFIVWGKFDRNKRGKGGKQGLRSDWIRFRELAQANAPITEFHDEIPHLSIVHRNKIEAVKADYGMLARRKFKTRPIVYFGPTRAGKSYSARALVAELCAKHNWRCYTKSDSEEWWPDYNGQEIVLIEEMDGSYFQWKRIKNVFDEGEFTLKQKYNPAGVNLEARYIIMTTNDHPSEWYPSKAWNESNPLLRRFRECAEEDPLCGLWNFKDPIIGPDGKKVYQLPVLDMTLEQPGFKAPIEPKNSYPPVAMNYPKKNKSMKRSIRMR